MLVKVKTLRSDTIILGPVHTYPENVTNTEIFVRFPKIARTQLFLNRFWRPHVNFKNYSFSSGEEDS